MKKKSSKKNNKKDKQFKVDYLRVFLILILIVSIILYFKIYLVKDNTTEEVDTLPGNMTNITWYEYDTYNTVKFTSNSFEYRDSEGTSLSNCRKYEYDKDEKIISFDCSSLEIRLVSVTDYRMVLLFNDEDVSVYYSSEDLLTYIIDNDLYNISDDELNEIAKNNDFKVSKENPTSYENTQISKLSSINELSIDDYLDLKNEESKKAVILLLNINMSVDYYDFIPVFISWESDYEDYNFYYINANTLTINDYYLLEEDEDMKEYLLGNYGIGILILDDDLSKRVDIEIDVDSDDEVFNCTGDACSDVTVVIYDNDKIYGNLDKVIKEMYETEESEDEEKETETEE